MATVACIRGFWDHVAVLEFGESSLSNNEVAESQRNLSNTEILQTKHKAFNFMGTTQHCVQLRDKWEQKPPGTSLFILKMDTKAQRMQRKHIGIH